MRPVSVRRGWGLVIVVGLTVALPAFGQEARPKLDVPYVPTNEEVVDEMLKLGGVTEKDFVIDLGCGDGRIVVAAAKKFKARGFGIDIDPQRIRESNQNAEKAGVTDMVKFELGDLMKADFRPASVLTMFLLESVNLRIRPKVLAELKPGTRVVSHAFTMNDWKPDKEIRHERAYSKVIYLWVVPAGVGGVWEWKTKTAGGEKAGSLKLDQIFQAISGTVDASGDGGAPIAEATLTGKEIRFTAVPRVGTAEVKIVYQGTVDGDAIKGTQEWGSGPNAGKHPWVAARQAVDLTGRWQIRGPASLDCDGTLSIQKKDDRLLAAYERQSAPGKEAPLSGFYIWGASIRFELGDGWDATAFCGTMAADAGAGRVISRPGQSPDTAPKWSAKRLATK